MGGLLSGARITATTNLGAGVTRTGDGVVVLVPGAVEGDVADVEIKKKRGSFYEGETVGLLSPSPYRQKPDCEAFEAGCGGCLFRHVSCEHELSVKADYIRTAMKKCGLNIEPEPFLTAGPDAVRSKVTVPVSDGESGYYARMTHKIVGSARCRLHDGETDEIRAYLSSENVPGLYAITVRRAAHGTMLILRADGDGGGKAALRAAAERAAERFPFIASAYVYSGGEYIHACGDDAIYDELAGCRFKISPASFYQVNHDGAELLYARAVELAELSRGELAADLFCGTGTIGIAAAKRMGCGLFGMEINASAVEDAKENAEMNGVSAEFVCGDAAEYGGGADVVFLDPPRAGCGKKLLDTLCKSAPRRIVYVSCDPATLARDAARLSGTFRTESVTPVDMFPRTAHVECVCLFSRRGGN